MRYVQRDPAGRVIGHYANPQTTRAGVLYTDAEPVPDDHPDLVQWEAEREARRAEPSPLQQVLQRLDELAAEVVALKAQR